MPSHWHLTLIHGDSQIRDEVRELSAGVDNSISLTSCSRLTSAFREKFKMKIE